ncbi:WD40 repeat-like protein [Ceratobasidium sp. AG-I]|nr:WD40 repeat-like protein [Ceratobasidium sp. AG-I]
MSILPATDMSLVPATSSATHPFRDVWTISGRQKGLITCTAISPSGMWLVSGSQDGTVLFVDYKAGATVAVLDLESRFYVSAAVWRSDTILVIGCSNGFVYHLDYEHRSKRPIAMHTLIKALKSPVRALAFDTFRDMLAIACGGETWIYVRSAGGKIETWDCVDHVLAPCAGAPGLVTSLCFFGSALTCRHLFIGHAKAGWTIWLTPRAYKRTPFLASGKICSIGSAAIAASERFIVISTLDQSLVTYALKEGGPVGESHVETPSQEITAYRPVLPVASTSSDLVLKGTSSGDVEILDTRTRSIVSLHHAHNHIIRTLNAYGDKVVVGSSEINNKDGVSCLRCYTFSGAAEPRDWRSIDESQMPVFEASLSNILPFTERVALYTLPSLNIGRVFHIFRGQFVWWHGLFSLWVAIVVILLALLLEPPATPAKTPPTSADDLAMYQEELPPRTPALSFLLSCGLTYLLGRIQAWCFWLGGFGRMAFDLLRVLAGLVGRHVGWAIKSLVYAIWVMPRVLRSTVTEAPNMLAEFICDILRAYEQFEICPQ